MMISDGSGTYPKADITWTQPKPDPYPTQTPIQTWTKPNPNLTQTQLLLLELIESQTYITIETTVFSYHIHQYTNTSSIVPG